MVCDTIIGSDSHVDAQYDDNKDVNDQDINALHMFMILWVNHTWAFTQAHWELD